jgi:hypothetical protein
VSGMFSSRKKLKVDLSESDDQKEQLSSFLRQTLNVEVTCEGHNLSIGSELPAQELQRQVNKFIYHQHLNNKYWVALENGAVRIRRFKEKKIEKQKKRTTPPTTIKHGW